MTLQIWVGHDEREPLSTRACIQSIRDTSPGTVVHKLDVRELRKRGLFSRPWRVTAEGQFQDELDQKPFSTFFSHSRFLVPTLARQLGVKHALFVDSDFIFLADPQEILNNVKSSTGVNVVKHNFFDKETTKKSGDAQENYNCKLWSALMLFNTENPYVRDLTPDEVNTQSGNYLHTFKWLPSHYVGEIDPSWHVLGPTDGPVNAVHLTYGTPEVHPKREIMFAELWHDALLRSMQ